MSSAVPNPPINYQGNSKIDREIAAEEPAAQEERKIQKIEGVTVVKKKASIGSRIKSGFGGADMQSVGSYLMWDVMVPAARDLIFDIIIEGARGSLYGDSARRGRSSGSVNGPIGNVNGGGPRIRQTNYNNASSRSPLVGSQQTSNVSIAPQPAGVFDFSNLFVESRDQAETILEKMTDAIEQYGLVSVAEFYSAIGYSGNGFTDQKYGWNMATWNGARSRAHRGGFLLEIPQPSPFE